MEDIIRNILTEMGYVLRDNGKEFRTRPIYRDSGNATSLAIKKDNGFWIDYSENIKGHFPELIKISLGLKDLSEAEDYIENKGYNFKVPEKVQPKLKQYRIFPKEYLDELEPDHKYWTDKGISAPTVAQFQGGVCKKGRMRNRYVFPIFDSKGNLTGYTGRYIYKIKDKSFPKWLHYGDKAYWKYPLHVNGKIIDNSDKIILVESIGDMLSLWEAGVKNVMVMFGIDVNINVINFLIRLDPESIIISFNNDEDNNYVGNKAAEKVKVRFLKYFDEGQIKIKLPLKNDFGDMTTKEIHEWVKTSKIT